MHHTAQSVRIRHYGFHILLSAMITSIKHLYTALALSAKITSIKHLYTALVLFAKPAGGIRLLTILALILSKLLLTSLPALAADTTRTRIAPGFHYIRITNPSQPVRISALEVNIAHPGVKIRTALAHNTLGHNFETTRSMARRYNQPGYTVVGALNGDYFGMGNPSNPYTFLNNIMVKDDEFVVGKPNSRSQFGIHSDGSPFVDLLRFSGEISLPETGPVPISALNHLRGGNQIVLYNHYFGNNTRTDQHGLELLMKKIDAAQVGQPIRFVIQTVVDGQGSMGIPDQEHYVLSATGELSAIVRQEVQPGDTLTAVLSFGFEVTGSFHAGSGSYPVSGRNTRRSENQIILYDRAGGLTTGTNEWGNEILLEPIGPVTLDGQSAFVVIRQESHVGNMEIPPGHYVISGHGGGRLFMQSNVTVGDTVTTELHSVPARDQVSQLMGGGPRLITEGQFPASWVGLESFTDGHNLGRHPRTAVGISKDSTRIWFMVVDGRQTASRGATMEETARIMFNLGAWNAVNLDGGGSSTLIIEDEWVHRPTDSDWMRPVGNALLAIAEPFEEDTFGGIRISPESKVVEVGEYFNFDVTGLDLWGDYAEVNSADIDWEIIDLEATFGRGGFLAHAAGEGLVVAHYRESYSDTARVRITTDLDSERAQILPQHYLLLPNYPNPFNPETHISWHLPEETQARITVYDIMGRTVTVLSDTRQGPGSYRVLFDASNLSSGTYIYELWTPRHVSREKMLLLK